MVTAHAGMKITHAEFDALAADLKAALQEFNVPQKEQDELLALVETTRGAIVEEA
jgi:hemoglobin